MTTLPTPLATALADRYRLERQVGAGGMATVYLAHDLRHDRKVAVKVLRPDLAALLGRERFLQEIRIAAGLQHPHILPVHDSGQAAGYLYYVMPFIEGMSLGQKLAREGALSFAEAIRILRDVADALAYAHRQGFVHRDIKPENVLLSDRYALVADFGVAKAVGRATGPSSLTGVGLAVGTPTYMAPEQTSGEPVIDHRADIYSFGVLAYEVLTGRPPFLGSGGQAVAAEHLIRRPDPVAARRQDVPPALDALVLRCLEKAPGDRWQSAGEIVARLEGMITPARGTSVTAARPAGAARRARRGALALGAIAAAAAAVLIWRSRPAPLPPLDAHRVLVAPFENATGDSSLAALAAPLEARIAEGLQQTGLVEVTDSRTAAVASGVGEGYAAASARRMAEEVGAGLVVVGRYVLARGDSLQLEASLLDLSDQSEPARINAIRVPRAAPEPGVTELAERAAGALALTIDPRWGLRGVPGMVAPTFASYREYQLGNEAFVGLRYQEAFDRLREAFRMDSTFLPYLIRAAYVLNNADDPRGVDSVTSLVVARVSRLSEFDRYYLERLQAWNRGDLEAALRAARGMAAVAPKSVFAAYAAARSALHVLRPGEAVAGLTPLAHGSDDVPTDDYYGDLSWAYHLLGRYDEEAATARAWDRDPATARPISIAGVWLRVAAAQGWDDSVAVMLGRVLSARPSPGTPVEGVLLAAARELRWHGRPEAASTVLEELLRLTSDQAPSIGRVEALTMLGRLDEASEVFAKMVAGAGGSWQVRAGQGILAALRGDTVSAVRAIRRLQQVDQPYLWGRTRIWQARIRAQLGDLPGAVALLRQAGVEGAVLSSFHADPLLEPLRDDPGFRDLTRPRD